MQKYKQAVSVCHRKHSTIYDAEQHRMQRFYVTTGPMSLAFELVWRAIGREHTFDDDWEPPEDLVHSVIDGDIVLDPRTANNSV